MKKYLYYSLKATIFIISLGYIIHYLDTNEFDCVKNCIFNTVTKITVLFLLITFILLFFENFRTKYLNILKLFIPAIFIIYSSKYYLEETKYKEAISIQKYYIDLNYELNYSNLNHIKKNSLSSIYNDLEKNKITFEKFDKDIDSYRLALGKSALIFIIGMFTILILDILSILFQRTKKNRN